MKKYWSLAWTMFKIGLFTFGGGYAMIALLEHEFVSKKEWISNEEFLDMVAIAESTPGPIAINSATYLGYKTGGVPGSILATVSVCVPSFSIIYAISLFFDSFLTLPYVQSAFQGIQACVVFLILAAGIRTFKKMKKSAFQIAILAGVVLCMTAFSLLSVKFSTLYYILIGGGLGLVAFAWNTGKRGAKK